MFQRINETLRDLILEILLFGFVFAAAGVLLVSEKLPYLCGLAAGSAISIGLAVHMYTSLDTALDMDSDSAVKYMRRASLFRMVLMVGAALVLAAFPNWFSIPGILIGIFDLKIAAYLQPFTNKYIFNKIFSRRKVRV